LCEHERETRKNQQSPGPAKLLSAAAPTEPAKSAKATSREVAKEDPARPTTADERKAARAKEAARTSDAKRLLSGLKFRWADGSRGLSSALATIQFALCADFLCRAGGGQGLAARAAVLSSCVVRPSGLLASRSSRKRLLTSRKAAADLTRFIFFAKINSRSSLTFATQVVLSRGSPWPQQPQDAETLSRSSP